MSFSSNYVNYARESEFNKFDKVNFKFVYKESVSSVNSKYIFTIKHANKNWWMNHQTKKGEKPLV